MNAQVRHILELGVFFASTIIILDALLIQIPVLDWFALGLAFFFIAASILASIARQVPWQRRKVISIPDTGNELEYLAHVIDSAVYRGDPNSSRILSEEIKSIVLGVVAVRTNLSKREILELAENHPENLRLMIQEDGIMKFLASYPQLDASLTEEKLEQTLSKIDSWSR